MPEIIQLSFGSNVKISLEVDPSPGCGGVAWPAGEVLASYLATKPPDFFENMTVLDLGSGTGLVGLVAGYLGARVYITDQVPLLRIMKRNVELNTLASQVTVIELNWGEPLPPLTPPPNLIVAADCVYFEPAFPLLVQTLADLAADGIPVFFCYKKRRKADRRFFAMLKKRFTWTEILDHPDRPQYSMGAITFLLLSIKTPKLVEPGRRIVGESHQEPLPPALD